MLANVSIVSSRVDYPNSAGRDLQALLRSGEVSRDRDVVTSLSGKVKIGETYELHLPAPEPHDRLQRKPSPSLSCMRTPTSS